jgi:AraC family transcriptional regulator of adaptative response/methylated-DNA-[protein]-cysteine methyltransferase
MKPNAKPVKRADPNPEQSGDYRRIALAIEFIRKHADTQPSLDRIARAAGLSSFHLQRLFSRWAGISPKRFLQALTIERAKALLRNQGDILGASFDAGLSGPGRLHDLFVSVEAMTPGEYKRRGAGLVIRYGFHPTPLGIGFVAATDRGICSLTFADSAPERAAIEYRFHREWSGARRIEERGAAAEAFAKVFNRSPGKSRPLSALVHGTNFQIQVWRALLAIPRGAAASYGGVARGIGRPTAHRAVAGAVAANPVGILIPCHRVLRQDGGLGGYRWGETRKAAALLLEMPR